MIRAGSGGEFAQDGVRNGIAAAAGWQEGGDLKDCARLARSIHEIFQPFLLGKAHGYCVIDIFAA
jgi:hypothetical protein